MADMRTVVTFRSAAFNTSERRDYFINDGCFGDDVARWLIEALQARGVATDSQPGQEDFGWYFSFRPGDTDHQFIVGYQPGDAGEAGTWVGWVERKAGVVASLVGARSRGIEPIALQAVHGVLATDTRVSSVRWHRRRDFDATKKDAGTAQPDAV